MAYTPSTLRDLVQDLEGNAGKVWSYTTTDADGTITGAGYFSDGVLRGMKVGDLVDAINTTGPKYKRYQVASVSGNAATVAAPTAIT